jgi:hypothetical protein
VKKTKDNLQTVDEIPEKTERDISSNDNESGNVRKMTENIEKKIKNKKGGTKKKHKNKKKRNKSLRRKS